MSQSDLNSDETRRRGKEIYERLRDAVETEENIGKIIAIDVETGDYEIDADILKAVDRLRARHPDGERWGERIGYDAVYAIGGTINRTTR